MAAQRPFLQRLSTLPLGQIGVEQPFDLPRKTQWVVPFCSGCDPQFVSTLGGGLEAGGLAGGRPLVRRDGEADFLVVVLEGTLQVFPDDPLRADAECVQVLQAPFVLCGFDRSRKVFVQAKSSCFVQRLTVVAATELARSHPDDTRTLVVRLAGFQVRSHIAAGLQFWNSEAVLRSLPPFEESAPKFIEEAARLLVPEIYLPGEEVVCEGDQVESTLILESGRCKIEKKSHKCLWTSDVVASIDDGFWIGGVGGVCGFAGELRRKATVRACSVCKIFRIPNSDLVQLLGRFPFERQNFRVFAEPELRSKDSDRLEDHHFFQKLPRQFLNTLRPKCRVHVYFADEKLTTQGEQANAMLILSVDSCVAVQVDGNVVKEINGRHCLGILALLRPRPPRRTATVITRAACAVRVLAREDWQDALKLFPEHRELIQAFTLEQEGMISGVREASHRRRAWERIQMRESAARHVQAARQKRQRELDKPTLPCVLTQAWSADGSGGGSARRSAASVVGAHVASKRTAWQASAEPPSCGAASARSKSVAATANGGPIQWECFNGHQVPVPHLHLPHLNQEAAHINIEDEDDEGDAGDDCDADTVSSSGAGPPKHTVRNARCSLVNHQSHQRDLASAGKSPGNVKQTNAMWVECDQALGLDTETGAFRAARKAGILPSWQ